MTTLHPRRTRVLALANQKGGVGKTTTAINLGTALAAIGERVMIIDLDPQGNASTGLGIDERRHSTSDVLNGKVPFAVARVDTNVPGLSVVPATIDLMAFERESMAATGRHYRLRDAIALMLATEDPASCSPPTSSSTVRRRSICSPSTRSPRPTPCSCRCNANSLRWKASRNS